MPNPNLSTNINKGKVESKAEKKAGKGIKFNFKNPFTPLIESLQDERIRKIVGVLFLITSAYLLLAFTAFLFTWQADYDKVSVGWFELLTNGEMQVQNWTGKFGALVSHLFIFQWFGLGALSFVLLSFLVGFQLLSKMQLLPLFKTAKHSLFFTLFLAVFFSYVFQSANELRFTGGGFGFAISEWSVNIMGNIGTFFLLLFLISTYLIANFNLNFNWLPGIDKRDVDQESDNILSDSTIETETESTPNATLDEQTSEEDEEENIAKDATLNEDKIQADGIEEIELSVDEATESTPIEPVPQELANTQNEVNLALEDDFEVVIPKEENEPQTAPEEELALDIEKVEEESLLSADEINDLVEDFGEYDPTLELSRFTFPPLDLLKDHGDGAVKVDKDELEANKNKIVETLRYYSIEIEKIKANVGPTVTLYEIVPAKGIRISKIKNLEDDIALSLAALGIRIIAPIPGKGTIGIEVPNQNPDIVSMRTVVSSSKFQNTEMALPVVIGKTILNETFVTDLAKMPHLLMAGATGQGKSVGLNCILVSLLYKKHPSQIKFVLVDPKKVELTLFNKIERHYLAKLPGEEKAIITDTTKVVNTLNSLCVEMDQRYGLLELAQVRTLKEYNEKFVKRKLNPNNGHRYMPYIVVVVDEFADLIMTAGKEVETPIARLAQLARAIGIHLIIATQRPSVNIITGTIKANFPSRIAFRVTSKIDSRTILDTGGADQLIGRGDMLFSNGQDLIRLQCAFVDTPEVEAICEYIGSQQGYADALLLPEVANENDGSEQLSLDDMDRDALFEEAARVVVIHQQGSASLLQRKLKLGYNRAGRIIDQLEAAGIIGPFEGSKARQVLLPDETSLNHFLDQLK